MNGLGQYRLRGARVGRAEQCGPIQQDACRVGGPTGLELQLCPYPGQRGGGRRIGHQLPGLPG